MAGILDEFLLIFKPTVQGSGFQKLNNQVKQTYDSLFNVKNLFRSFVGYDIYSGLKQFATGLIDSSKELGAMTSRFYAITKSEQLANEELQWTFDLAKRTAMGLKETADSYSIFYSATQRGLGTEGARQVFQDWTEVSRVLHLSTYQFERVTYALREMASKGAIYSQDLRMQIGTHVPNAMGLAEKAVNELGVTGTNWFDDFREKAKGNQKLINQFIVLFSKYAKQMYASPEALANAMKKPDAQIQTLLNHWKEFQYAIVRGGFEKDLVGVLSNLNKILDSIVEHAPAIYKITKVLLSLVIASQALKGMQWLASTKYVKSLATTFKYWKGTLGVFKTLGVLLKGSVFLGLFNLLKGLSVSGLTALFMTPPGWVILGLSVISGLAVWFKNKFPNAWKAIFLKLDTFFTNMKILLTQLGIKLGLIQTRTNIEPTDSPQVIAEKQKQITLENIEAKKKDIQVHGGYWANDKYGSLWDVYKLTSKISELEHSVKHSTARPNTYQQKYIINVENNIGSVRSDEDVRTIMTEMPLALDKIKDWFKNNSKSAMIPSK